MTMRLSPEYGKLKKSEYAGGFLKKLRQMSGRRISVEHRGQKIDQRTFGI